MIHLTAAKQILLQGLQQLGMQADTELLLAYLSLLFKWNQAYNLTAVRELTAMVTRHLLDSLAIAQYLHGLRVLDVGSGAGLPGIPLALAYPKLDMVLIDSNGKKIRFMQEVKRVLTVSNISIVHARVENYHPEANFDTVVSRAVSELRPLIAWTRHLIGSNGKWLAMKGHYPETELMAINYPYQVQSYEVPGLDSERCCVIIDNVTKESSWQKS